MKRTSKINNSYNKSGVLNGADNGFILGRAFGGVYGWRVGCIRCNKFWLSRNESAIIMRRSDCMEFHMRTTFLDLGDCEV